MKQHGTNRFPRTKSQNNYLFFFGFTQNKKPKHGRIGPQRDKPVPVFVFPKAIIFSKFSFRNLVAKKYCSRLLVIMWRNRGYFSMTPKERARHRLAHQKEVERRNTLLKV